MRLGAVTYNVLKDWNLETIITNLELFGYEAVELRTGHKHGVEPTIDAAARQQVTKLFTKSKVRLLSFGSTCEFQSPDESVRRKNIEDGKRFIELAHDTGAWAVKVRPNGLPPAVPRDTTIKNIGLSIRELADFGTRYGVEVWMEVHGKDTQDPPNSAAIMRATNHPNAGLCWNSNPTDVINSSVKQSFDLLRPWIKNCHINELISGYPYRELFALLRQSKYDRYMLCEAQESKEPERFLRMYRALWMELNRS